MIGRSQRRALSGGSLLELLLALSLAALILIAALQLLQATQSAFSTAHRQLAIQQVARLALQLIAPAVQHAGYLGDELLRGTTAEYLSWLHGERSPWLAGEPFVAAAVVAGKNDISGRVQGIDVKEGSDILLLRRRGDGDGLLSDCRGVSRASRELLRTTFFVSGTNQLYCEVRVGQRSHPPVALLDGIADMQLSYFIADAAVWRDSDRIDDAQWPQVAAVMVTLRVVAAPLQALSAQRGWQPDGDSAAALFSQTLALRNRLVQL